jgi:peptide/nickel transport system substrate-binding protein
MSTTADEGQQLPAMNISRRRFLGLAALSTSVSLLGMLHFDVPAFAAPVVVGQGAPTSGGELIVSTWDEHASMDPIQTGGASADLLPLMGDNIVNQAEDLSISPGLATSWDVNPEGTEYTFHLAPGVKFWDGTPFNADAVKYNLDRMTGPSIRGYFPLSLRGIYQDTQIIDDQTAKVILSQPYGAFLGALAFENAVLVSPTAAEKLGKDFEQHPVLSGPYIFDEWIPKSTVSLHRNPDYTWGPPLAQNRAQGYPDKITIRLIADSPTREATLETGELSIARDLEPQEFAIVQGNSQFQNMRKVQTGFPWMYVINTKHPPLDDVNVRRALNWATNQEDLVQVLSNGISQPAHTILSPGTFAYDPAMETKYYHYDPAKAASILDAAGWTMGPDGIRQKGGQKLQWELDIINPAVQALPIKIAEPIQANYRAVGIQMDIKQWDPAPLFATMVQGDEKALLWFGGGPDPDYIRAHLYSQGYGHVFTQVTGVQDPAVDKMILDAAAELDVDKRQQMYVNIVDWAMDQAIYVPLFYKDNLVGMQPSVHGVKFNPYADLFLRDTWLGQQ